MFKKLIFLLVASTAVLLLKAQSPVVTDYSYAQCAGSSIPYAKHFDDIQVPDSLTAVVINHVGRHGARYPTSADNCEYLASVLHKAEDQGTLTPRGRSLLALTERVLDYAAGRWGRLDSLGQAEQREIAARMYVKYHRLFTGDSNISAISSWKPRCRMSMYEFLHQLSLLSDKLQITSQSGPDQDRLMRFFDGWKKPDVITEICRTERDNLLPDKPQCAVAVVGEEMADRKLAQAMYAVVSTCGAMEMSVNPAEWFSREEYNILWSLKNLSQYLDHSASIWTTQPAELAGQLMAELIFTTDRALSGAGPQVMLRFGHAETLMPLLSLMRVKGAYYISSDPATVATNWRDFDLVPMAANLQIVIFKSTSGKKYARVDLNEIPTPILPGSDEIYVEWEKLRSHWLQLLPRELSF
ncbi:MAG: histidine-type phosphatase [Muribaculaceae bacterium]|nr:histidine-type phosphatase [Muribaculaceae bacterium]